MDDLLPASTEVTARDRVRKHPKLRTYVTGSWVAVIVIFTAARIFVVKETLEKYGLNIWVFGFIDLITAVPYALGVARVITSLIDHEKTGAMKWAIVAVASFLAPYLYVAWAGRGAEFPTAVWVVLGALIAVFGANAMWSAYRKVKRGRVEHGHARTVEAPVAPQTSSVAG